MDDKDNDKKIFEEKLLLNGFKLVAIEEIDKLPAGKRAFLLKTKDKKLQRELKRWASKNDVVMLINPPKITYNQCKKLFAVVVDDACRDQFEYKHKLKDKFISGNADLESIKDFLEIQRLN